MLRTIKLAVVASGLVAVPAMAKSLQCNKQQTRCLAEDTNLSIGDQVGVFNDDGDLVATGEVNAMKGERRAVLINDRHGTINKNYHMALLETKNSEDLSAYRAYHEPAQMEVGGSFGYSTMSVGMGSPATEMSAYAQWRKWGGLQLIGRATYLMMAGQVAHDTDTVSETIPMNIQGLGLLGGVGYTIRPTRPISFRGEAAVGGMQVAATAGGDRGIVDDGEVSAKVKNGLNPYGRWSLGSIYNLDTWHLHLDFAQSLISEAMVNTLAAGVSKDLR